MKILAFDTCLQGCSVALVEADANTAHPLAHITLPLERGHAEILVPMIRDVLNTAGAAIADVERIAVTNGPGTFTGVRIGVAVARALALARDIPAFGVSTLEAIAANMVLAAGARATPDTPVAAVIDARREAFYFQMFDAALTPLCEPGIAAIGEVIARLERGRVRVAGSGIPALAAAMKETSRIERIERIEMMPAPLPDAAVFAALAARRPVPASPVSALYLRPPDAKLPAGDARVERQRT